MGERQTYRQTYRKPWPVVNRRGGKPGCLATGFRVVEERLMAAGRVIRDGKELEYVDVRFYTENKP